MKERKTPLLMSDQEIIDSLKQEIFQLREIIDNFPGDVYWKDRNGVWLGVNKRGSESLNVMGFLSDPKVIVGKTDEEIFGVETSKIYRDNDFRVMNENREVAVEEETTLPSGEKVFKLSTKKPLYNYEQTIVGIIGSSMDITARKEAEKLRFENESQKTRIEEQEKFSQIANQLSHDIRSPLAATQIWYESIRHKLSEQERLMGGNALERALDILNSGFVRYKKTDEDDNKDKLEPVMISLALEQIVAEKRLEYQNESVTLSLHCDPEALFAFVSVRRSALKRMVSNLINNAVDAFDNKTGSQLTVYLSATATTVTLRVEDNGKGMPDAVKKKILHQEAVTDGKAHGNGIGFTQIWDTLRESHAKLAIKSKPNQGTCIDAQFPRIATPHWFVTELSVADTQTIVVVDDDPSIHHAWDARFQALLPHKKLVHFEQGEQAVVYLNSVASKEDILLLTDYELLNQPINGLDLIEQTKIPHAILVTSHTENKAICERAILLNTQLLPKQCVPNIALTLQKTSKAIPSSTEVVVMDDDTMILNSIVPFVFAKRTTETFTRPQECLAKLDSYDKNTAFFMDNHYGSNPITGIDVAKQLYVKGFRKLYLLTGDDAENTGAPDYLTVILKTDTERLKFIADNCFQEQSAPPLEKETQPETEITLPCKQTSDANASHISELLRHLSHEVLNSLSIIQVNTDLIQLIEESTDKTGEEMKEAILERVGHIRQSRKECTQILRMEIAKLRAAYPSIAISLQHCSMRQTIENAIADYVFREGEANKIAYDGTTFDYHGEPESMKQMIFHIIRQGLQAVKGLEGQLTFHCAQGDEQFHQLIVRYPEELSCDAESDELQEENAVMLETKFSEIFCQSVMATLGGYIEHSIMDNIHQTIFYFPVKVPEGNQKL